MQTFEKCSVYTTSPQGAVGRPGKPYLGGSQRILQEDPTPQRILRALDIRTGKIDLGAAADGPGHVVGRHAGDGERAGHRRRGQRRAAWPSTRPTGKPLWTFPTNAPWRASPMTYTFDGRQHIAIAAGATILSFALPK